MWRWCTVAPCHCLMSLRCCLVSSSAFFSQPTKLRRKSLTWSRSDTRTWWQSICSMKELEKHQLDHFEFMTCHVTFWHKLSGQAYRCVLLNGAEFPTPKRTSRPDLINVHKQFLKSTLILSDQLMTTERNWGHLPSPQSLGLHPHPHCLPVQRGKTC